MLHDCGFQLNTPAEGYECIHNTETVLAAGSLFQGHILSGQETGKNMRNKAHLKNLFFLLVFIH